VASLSQGRTAAAQCGLFTHKSVPVIFEPPCITVSVFLVRFNQNRNISTNLVKIRNMKFHKNASCGGWSCPVSRDGHGEAEANCRSSQLLCERGQLRELRLTVKCRPCCCNDGSERFDTKSQVSPLSKEDCTTPYVKLSQFVTSSEARLEKL